MNTQLLTTKLYIPAPRPDSVLRKRLLEQVERGLHGKLTLVSAPAGFGKTTLVSEWASHTEQPVAWLSLDGNDSEPRQFLLYVVAALQTVIPDFGEDLFSILNAPQLPPIDALLTPFLNELASIPQAVVLVLDDYHVLDNADIDAALAFLLDNLPQQVHLVITTREDPQLPLARLRARGQLTEIRAADLRFRIEEAAAFFQQVVGMELSSADIEVLDARTEGWVAGLQMAGLSMKRHDDIVSFIESFTGSHHFVLDYLVEEVLSHQPEHIRQFLLRTSILNRLCGPLCDAILSDNIDLNMDGQDTLMYLQRANLFLIPLDSERKWFRYHHLFGDLLRQRLHEHYEAAEITMLNHRASEWFEEHNFEMEAFRHAIAANDIERATHIIESDTTPLYLRGSAPAILSWLESLPTGELDKWPMLWVIYGWSLWVTYRSPEVEDKLQRAEAALERVPEDSQADIIGNIAAMRALLAANDYQIDTIIAQSQRALEFLHSANLYVRAAVKRSLGYAYQFKGDRVAAKETYSDVIRLSEESGNVWMNMLASTGLAMINESDNQLHLAVETYQKVIDLLGQPSPPAACAAYLGLARIHYQWNMLDEADAYASQGVELARLIEGIDTAASGQILLARIQLARGETEQAAESLSRTAHLIYHQNYTQQVPKLVALQIRLQLQQGHLAAARKLLEGHDLPCSRARIYLAMGEAQAALAVLEPYYQAVVAKGWHDETLKTRVLQALALYGSGNTTAAVEALGEAFKLAREGGFIRLFLDEGASMFDLISDAHTHVSLPRYSQRILDAFHAENQATTLLEQPLIEPLTERELEVLHLIAEGLSNREIGERLFIALPTVKGHNRIIYSKLQVSRRTEAVARAQELGLL